MGKRFGKERVTLPWSNNPHPKPGRLPRAGQDAQAKEETHESLEAAEDHGEQGEEHRRLR